MPSLFHYHPYKTILNHIKTIVMVNSSSTSLIHNITIDPMAPISPGPLRFQRGMPAALGAANRGAVDDGAAEHRELRGIHGVVSMYPEGHRMLWCCGEGYCAVVRPSLI
jgi:hypothetical protein